MEISILIRQANEGDAERIQELSWSTFHDTFAAFNSPEDMRLYLDNNFSLELISNALKEAGTTFLLAYHNERAVGYAKMKTVERPRMTKDEKALEIERIYVVREYFGKNVGKSLLDTCLQLAKQQGSTVVWLGVWEHNPRAIAFYKKWGFKKFGEHEFVLGTDIQTDWLMKKEL